MSEQNLQLLLEMLRHIPKNRKITADEMHAKLAAIGFQRDKRSIQRNLKKLAEYFPDIEMDERSKPYGYRWLEKSAGLALPTLTEAQALVLLMAQEQLKHQLPNNILASMSSFFEQAKRTLVFDHKNSLASEWLGKVAAVPLSYPVLPAAIDSEMFNEVSMALFHNRQLTIEYRNLHGKTHTARVCPLALVQQEARTYLVVQYEDEQIRHLALNRFLSVRALQQTFERPLNFDLESYCQAGHFYYGDQRMLVRFDTTPMNAFYFQETPLSTDQIVIAQNADSVRFQATVVDSRLFDWWLAKFGDEIWNVEKEKINP
ncbi:MAG: WYL domain-containing protein [Neisseria sp.]|nr:WYL domain-containing protein [Neisseria sp.]